jgi:hypothetical protein
MNTTIAKKYHNVTMTTQGNYPQSLAAWNTSMYIQVWANPLQRRCCLITVQGYILFLAFKEAKLHQNTKYPLLKLSKSIFHCDHNYFIDRLVQFKIL